MAEPVKLHASFPIGFLHETVEDEAGTQVVPVLDADGNLQPVLRRIQVRFNSLDTMRKAKAVTAELQSACLAGDIEALVEVAGIWAGRDVIEEVAQDLSVDPEEFFFTFIPWVIERCVPFHESHLDGELPKG